MAEINWRPAPAPTDGKPFWAYLYESGIRKMRFVSAVESAAHEAERTGSDCDPNDYENVYAEVADPFWSEWTPRWWLPLEEFNPPPGTSDA